MELLRRNVERNPGNVKCEHLLWGDIEKIKQLGRFDVVIGCDIVALPYVEAFSDLAETLIGLSHTPSSVAATAKATATTTATTTTTAITTAATTTATTTTATATEEATLTATATRAETTSLTSNTLAQQGGEYISQENADTQGLAAEEGVVYIKHDKESSATSRRKQFDGSDMQSSVVLLAYKARHCTEEPFFELSASRGFAQYILPREKSIHPDFLNDTSLSIMKLTL
jgi:hypothetical protein